MKRIADDFEALNAGLKRIEAERLRILNGTSEAPESLPIEAYDGAVNYDDPNEIGNAVPPYPPGYASSAIPIGAVSTNAYGMTIVWNGSRWVDKTDWKP